MATRVIGYIRVSTEHQADGGISLEAQRTKLEAYATALELELVGIEVDAGASAKTLNRPGLQTALGRLDAGEADALLVPKLDRLTRSVKDLASLIEGYFEKRFSLLSVGDSIDTRSAAGRLILNVLTSVGQWEREATGERTKEALSYLKAQGVKLGGEALGWKRTAKSDDSGRLIVADVRKEVAAVKRILKLRGKGKTLRSIAETMTLEGYQTKRGGQWHASTVGNVVRRAA
ncbi:MAG TPA: recombinase family protein [Myxococcales bacterium]|nr:recombinase family protein [Myxococcales bacterium]